MWAQVKTEKSDRSEYWVTLKAKKFAESKKRVESMAFEDGEDGEGKV